MIDGGNNATDYTDLVEQAAKILAEQGFSVTIDSQPATPTLSTDSAGVVGPVMNLSEPGDRLERIATTAKHHDETVIIAASERVAQRLAALLRLPVRRVAEDHVVLYTTSDRVQTADGLIPVVRRDACPQWRLHPSGRYQLVVDRYGTVAEGTPSDASALTYDTALYEPGTGAVTGREGQTETRPELLMEQTNWEPVRPFVTPPQHHHLLGAQLRYLDDTGLTGYYQKNVN